MIDLFEHNQKAYDFAVEILAKTSKTTIIHPTGTGKSFIGFKLCEEHPDKKVCWLSPSEYIFKTQIENLKIASHGYVPKNIEFFTYAKLMNLSEKELSEIVPDFIILDEFHRCGAEFWGQGVQNLLNQYPEVPILGLSATNIRYLDNQRDMADELFDGNIASEMTLGEAIVRGILHPPKYVLSVYSYQKDLEKYERRVRRAKNKAVRDAGEKYLEALRRTIEKADGLDVVFDKHMTDKTGKYIIFCSDKEHMDEMMEHTEWFERIDKKPRVYSLYTEDPAASKSFQAFKEDKDDAHLRLLYAIDALNEGVHVEDVSGVILLRPTISPIIYKQQIGRALSASKKKEPVIFDIVNNIENLYSIGAIEEEMRTAVTYYRYLGEGEKIVNERFKVYDEVQNCKTLFEKLEDTLSASWDYMYLEAKKYYKANRDLEVPKRYKTPEGYSLGNWLHTQRRVRAGEQFGQLDEERIAKLDAIGMRWGNFRDLAWERYFTLAKQYFEENGNLDIKALHVTKDGVRLGAWICNLRSLRKNSQNDGYLSNERIARLDEIGMIWDQPDYVFERNYAAALEYYRLHGNLDIPANCTLNGVKLGIWIRNLRVSVSGKHRQLIFTEEQINRLNQIGMIWEDKPTLYWNTGFAHAKEYYEKHGNLGVPLSYKCEDGYELYKWVYRQWVWYQKGKLPEERVALLNSIGMNWGYSRKNDWNVCFGYAKEFFEKNGHLNIPHDYKADGIWLNKWLNEQRQIYIGNRKNKKLTEEQIKRLETIGMIWENRNHIKRNNAWNNQFKAAQEFYQKYGHLTVPGSYDSGNDRKLAVWVLRQRALKANGKLPEEQIKMLESIGMIWSFDDPWENGFAHAQEYYTEKGDLLVNSNYVCSDGYNLGGWISNQRANGKSADKYRKLDAVQIERLNSIGMIWNVDDFRWEQTYKLVADFYRENKHLVIPRYYGEEKSSYLYEWVMQQRNKYRSGELSEDKIRKLASIGMDWLTAVERDWEKHYESAERYYHKHGTLEMPCTYVDEAGFPLGMWLWRIRTNKVKLRTSGANGNQLERLKAIGF